MSLKQKMVVGLASLISSAKKLAIEDDGSGGPAPMAELFTKVDPAIDDPDCMLDCQSCTVQYPRRFWVNESDVLYGHVKPWSTHILVATSKSDWSRDIAHEKGSVMEALDKAAKPTNGVRLAVSRCLMSCSKRSDLGAISRAAPHGLGLQHADAP